MELATSPSESAWGLARRVAFRFAFAYLVLYNLPLQELTWDAVVLWVGRHVFGVEITFRPAGSGDTTWSYVLVFCQLVLAATLTLAWSLLDRHRSHYRRLHEWLRVLVRFCLAMYMIMYGSVKVIRSQFPPPPIDWLMTTYGESSPMRLLWTFMGASEGYNLFTGGGEMLGGLLLCTRRTALLGALVSGAVMAHVLALNLCYDVPVKLFSIHLLLMATFLVWPDLPWLTQAFLLGRKVESPGVAPLFRRRWAERSALALRTVVVVAFTVFMLADSYQDRKAYGDLAPRPPLYGLWEVEAFEADGKALPPLTTEAARWKHVSFGRAVPAGAAFTVQTMAGARAVYRVEVDPEAGAFTVTKRPARPGEEGPPDRFEFKYAEPGPGVLTVEGELEKRRIRATLRRVDESEFLLTSRGFRWVTETSFNVAQPRGAKK